MIRQDFIKRLIEQLAAALARMAGQRVELELALETLDQVKGQLPILRHLLETESPETLRRLLGDDETALVVAQLFVVEGRVEEHRGETKAAIRLYAKAVRLFLLCGGATTFPEHSPVFQQLAARWFPTSLSETDRARLGR